jgi:hypothetical protein
MVLGMLDEEDDVVVVHDMDLALALPAGGDQVGAQGA